MIFRGCGREGLGGIEESGRDHHEDRELNPL